MRRPLRVETASDGALSRHVTGRLSVATRGQGFTDITPALREWIAEIGASDGLLSAFVTHTTASLVIQENADVDVRRDLLDVLDRLAPERAGYRHRLEGPDDMPAHVKATLTDVSVVMPVADGRLTLGQWQSLYLVEHRRAPHERSVQLAFVGR